MAAALAAAPAETRPLRYPPAASAAAPAAPAAAAPAAAAPAPAYDSNGFRKYYEERAAVSGSGVVRPIARLV